MSTVTIEKEKIFIYNDRDEDFREIERVDKSIPKYQLLVQDSILLFIDEKRKRVWMWIGHQCNAKMKFRATQSSYHIRDRYAFGFKITTVDEGNETFEFKIFIGLEEEQDINVEVKPQYNGTVEQEEFIEFMKEEQMLRILNKSEMPEGYERRMVIVNNDVYLYKEYPHSLGSDIKQKRLFKRKEKIDDGWILLEDYTPRILFSSNKLIVIELLQKV